MEKNTITDVTGNPKPNIYTDHYPLTSTTQIKLESKIKTKGKEKAATESVNINIKY